MKGLHLFIAFSCLLKLSAQENSVSIARDGFLSVMTDARAAGQGDIGVATSADAFSQYWNPAKYVFSDKSFEIGVTQGFPNRTEFNEFSQLNFIFYNKMDERSAYALSVRNYAYTINEFIDFGTFNPTHEVAIDGSYTLKLSNVFAMSVAGRFISLKGKVPSLDGFNDKAATSLYGIDVSGYFYGNEIAYKNFNGRWRAGFNFSNLRGKSLNDTKDIEIYAPSLLKTGIGFDFVFDLDHILAITTTYKMLLDDYTKNESGEPLIYGIEGSVWALGLEYTYREKLVFRTGFSKGINRVTDTFGSLGAGFKGRYAEIDISFLLGLSEDENLIREKIRVSLGLDLDEVF